MTPTPLPSLSIVIPCCNEAEGIPHLESKLFPIVEALARTRYVELIFVDDGSRDQTLALLKQLKAGSFEIKILQHKKNRGLGAALRTGFQGSQGQVVISTDSDGTYHFDQIPKILDLLTPGVDIVTASPYHSKGGVENVPPYRLVLSRGASFVYEMLLGMKLATYTSMFRAYRREVLEKVPFHSDGFLSVTELLVNAILMGFKVVEYPTVLTARQTGASKAKVLRIIRAHLKYQSQVLLTRLGISPRPQAR